MQLFYPQFNMFIKEVLTQNSQWKIWPIINNTINVYKLLTSIKWAITPANISVTIMSVNPNGPKRSLWKP